MITAGGWDDGGETVSPPTPPMLPCGVASTRRHRDASHSQNACVCFPPSICPAICKLFVSARDIPCSWASGPVSLGDPTLQTAMTPFYPNFYGPNHASLCAPGPEDPSRPFEASSSSFRRLLQQTPRSGWGSAVPERPPTCEIAAERLPNWDVHSRSHLSPAPSHSMTMCEQPPWKHHMTEMPSKAPRSRARQGLPPDHRRHQLDALGSRVYPWPADGERSVRARSIKVGTRCAKVGSVVGRCVEARSRPRVRVARTCCAASKGPDPVAVIGAHGRRRCG